MKPEFKGYYLPIGDLIGLLRSQGLVIEDEARARNILANVSYARLKSYMIPLMEDRASHRFRPGATFGQAYALYGFDRRLRELLFHEMEKFEISLRTHISYVTSESDKGYWFTNPEYFKNPRAHDCMLKKILNVIKPNNNFALRLRNLIDSFTIVSTAPEMGFPSGWKDDPFWRVW